MVEVSTSLLSMKEKEEVQIIMELEKAKTDYYHIDVMDGEFVEKNTYEKMLNNAMTVKRLSNIPLDVHLMINDIQKGIEDFLPLEPNVITIHYEACESKEKVYEYIQLIKENHCKVGISIKPNTKIEEIYEFLPYIHLCLIMTVEPGKGGQTLISEMINKIKELKKYINEKGLEIDIEVDGGINLKTAPLVKAAGANILVAGTAILKARNYRVIIEELKK